MGAVRADRGRLAARRLAVQSSGGTCVHFAPGILCITKLGREMRDLDRALADIFAIRSQIAAGTAFRGYGPATVAATGGLALATALIQFWWLDDPTGRPLTFLAGWAATALVSGAIIWIEM